MNITYHHDYSRGSTDTTEFNKSCIHCEAKHVFKLSASDYEEVFYKRRFMQDIFPDLSMDQRELMISGTCKSCWDEIFPPDEDEIETKSPTKYLDPEWISEKSFGEDHEDIVLHYVVDIADDFVLYVGSPSDCETVLEQNYAGLAIVTYDELTENMVQSIPEPF